MNKLFLTLTFLCSCASGPSPIISEKMALAKKEIESCDLDIAKGTLNEIGENPITYELIRDEEHQLYESVQLKKPNTFIDTIKEALSSCEAMNENNFQEIDAKKNCFNRLASREDNKVNKLISLAEEFTSTSHDQAASLKSSQPFFLNYSQVISSCSKKEIEYLEKKEAQLELAIENDTEIKAKKDEEERNKKESTPEYKKCRALQANIDAKKFLKFWEYRLVKEKEDANLAGVITSNRAQSIDSAVRWIKTYKFMLKDSERDIGSLSGTNVNEKQCKKFIEGFGKSRADDLMDLQ